VRRSSRSPSIPSLFCSGRPYIRASGAEIQTPSQTVAAYASPVMRPKRPLRMHRHRDLETGGYVQRCAPAQGGGMKDRLHRKGRHRRPLRNDGLHPRARSGRPSGRFATSPPSSAGTTGSATSHQVSAPRSDFTGVDATRGQVIRPHGRVSSCAGKQCRRDRGRASRLTQGRQGQRCAGDSEIEAKTIILATGSCFASPILSWEFGDKCSHPGRVAAHELPRSSR